MGAILRTADACQVELVYTTGYTPHPGFSTERPAHVATANTRAIAKTALGAEATVPVRPLPTTLAAIHEARAAGFSISVIEQAENSLSLYDFRPAGPLALVVGNEVDGVAPEILAAADTILELPMLGAKESLNVAVAASIALYQIRFGSSAPA